MDILQSFCIPSLCTSSSTAPSRVPFAMPDRAARHLSVHGGGYRRHSRGWTLPAAGRAEWPPGARNHPHGLGRGATAIIAVAIRCSCAIPNGPRPKLRPWRRPSRSFHAPVDIQVYLTPDQQQAFGWHYDLEEVFIIQVQGCKEYTLRQNTVNPLPVWDTMPEDMGYERETSRLRMTCRLEAGDWLYIPSGWWHIARTQAASLHLSIGVMPVTRLKLFAFLARYLAQFPFWCQRLALVQPGNLRGDVGGARPPELGRHAGAAARPPRPGGHVSRVPGPCGGCPRARSRKSRSSSSPTSLRG